MADMALLKAQVMRGVAWATATRLIGQMLNWVMTLAVVHFLRPSDYGLMAIVWAVTGFLGSMSTVGFSDALVQSRDAEAAAGEAFGLILLANAVFTVVLFSAAPAIATFYHDPRLVVLLRIVSFSFLTLGLASLSRANLQRELALKQMSAIDVAGSLSNGITTIVMAWQGFGVWSLLAGSMVSEVLRTVGYLWISPLRHWPKLPSRRQASLMRKGSYRTAENTLWYFTTQLDVLITGRVLGSIELGIYSLARTLASLPIDRLAGVVKPIGLPAFARLQDDPDQALGYLGKSMRVLALLSFPVFFGLSSVAWLLVPIVLGPRWIGAAEPLAILTLAMTFRPTGLFLAPFLLGLGHFRTSFLITVFTFVLFAAAYLIGAQFGLIGVCVGAAIAYPIAFVAMVQRVSVVRKGLFGKLMRPLLRPLLSAVLMYGAVELVRWLVPGSLSAGAHLALMIGTGVVVYTLCVWLMCRDIAAEVVSMLGLDRWRRRRSAPAVGVS